MEPISQVSSQRASSRRDDGQFEKCALSSAAWLLPLLGAGAGAGIGAYTNSIKPEDEDEDHEKRKTESILLGTGAGTLGGAGLAAVLGMMGVGRDKSTLERLADKYDPSWSTGLGTAGVLNAITPSREGIRRIIGGAIDTKRHGTYGGLAREQLNNGNKVTGPLRKLRGVLFGYDPVAPGLQPGTLFSNANKATTNALIDAVYNAATDSARASAKDRLATHINSLLGADRAYASAIGGSVTHPAPFARGSLFDRVFGKSWVGNLRAHGSRLDRIAGRGRLAKIFGSLRSGTGRTMSGALGLAALLGDAKDVGTGLFKSREK